MIIGAGPAGIGAGFRLHEKGYDNWALYERHDCAGGHASSFVDSKGFTWDEGGHVIFSHYPYFDRLVDRALHGEVHECVRESWVVNGNVKVPYPFQNNLRYLPKEAQIECLSGAARVWGKSDGKRPTNFRDWILDTFGEGIAKHFMFPYNLKVWTTPLDQMSAGWISERVSVLDFERLLQNVILERDDVAWGPNSKFRFPLHGGTGEIYRRIARPFEGKVNYGKELRQVNTEARTLEFADGSGDRYDALITTVPLDLLVKMMSPPVSELVEATADLRHNDLLVLGIGLRRKIDTSKCWIYFSDKAIPCYRATYFSQYSPFNVPGGDTDTYSSIMCEMSQPAGEAADADKAMEKTIDGLVETRILDSGDRSRIVSRYVRAVPYSYPIPTLNRDRALGVIQSFLIRKGIYSRGRFGAWRYEIGNMDHSVMMGVEAVNNLLDGERETTFLGPQ